MSLQTSAAGRAQVNGADLGPCAERGQTRERFQYFAMAKHLSPGLQRASTLSSMSPIDPFDGQDFDPLVEHVQASATRSAPGVPHRGSATAALDIVPVAGDGQGLRPRAAMHVALPEECGAGISPCPCPQGS